MSERLACRPVGLACSTCRRLPRSQIVNDPDAEMRTWLCSYAAKHPRHGFRGVRGRDDDLTSGGDGAAIPGRGVFDDRASGGRNREGGRGALVRLRIWFGLGDIVSGDACGEQVADAHPVGDIIDPFSRS